MITESYNNITELQRIFSLFDYQFIIYAIFKFNTI